MTGNCHVRFLGEGVAVMPPPYPTRMDGKRRTPVSPAVAAGEGRSILPAKESSVPTHGIMCSNIHMDIENTKTAVFVPLLGAFNFEHKSMGALGIPDEFSFRMDWTKGGEGQEVLREHIRSRTG